MRLSPPLPNFFNPSANNRTGNRNSATNRALTFGAGNDSAALQARDTLAVLGPKMAVIQRLASEGLYNQQQKEVVAAAALNLGQAMGLPPERLGLLLVAADYYNSGKDPRTQSLWLKTEPLTPEEEQELQQYPMASVNKMVAASVEKRAQGRKSEADELDRAIPIVLTHKYNFGGGGYSNQAISGSQIPLEAQILGVVDAYYAMISQRLYRPAMAPEAALQTLQSEAGSKWNPAVVEAFIRKTQ